MVSTHIKKGWQVIFLLIACLFAYMPQVEANELQSVDVKVHLTAKGEAQITETWKGDFDEGTELYKPLTLQDAQSLEDLNVKVNGEAMQATSTWDIDADFDTKAYHYGQNDDEINWGISTYGTNTYEVSYTVTNFVAQTASYQMIYWEFITDSIDPAPEKISVTLTSDTESFNADNNRIWGFGYDGTVKFSDDGKIEAKNKATFTSDNYVTLLIRMPEQTYPTNFQLERDFDSYVKQSFEGSNYDWEDYDPNATSSEQDVTSDPMTLGEKISAGGAILGFGGLGILGIWSALRVYHNVRKRNAYYPTLAKQAKNLAGEYYRKPPFKDIFTLYVPLTVLSAHNSQLMDDEVNENMVTATLLWLIKQGILQTVPSEKSGDTTFIIQKEQQLPEPVDRFYQMLERASDADGRLTQKRLKQYIEGHYQQYDVFIQKLRQYSLHELEAADYIYHQLQAKKRADMTTTDIANEVATYPLTPAGIEKRDQLVKFHNYLLDYSLLNERSAAEVQIWDELMLYAAALGILDEVEKEFAKLYPNYRQESVYTNGQQLTFTDYYILSQLMRTSRQQGYQAAHPSTNSGGGGFSSMGGGGGAFGGGSGGGVR